MTTGEGGRKARVTVDRVLLLLEEGAQPGVPCLPAAEKARRRSPGAVVAMHPACPTPGLQPREAWVGLLPWRSIR